MVSTKKKKRSHRNPGLARISGVKQRRRRLGIRAHLPRWIKYLQNNRFSPLAWVTVLLDTQREGLRRCKGLTRLRRSFRHWVILLLLPFVLLSYLLVELSRSHLSLLLVLGSLVWFSVVARYCASQLSLVKPPGSRTPLQHFHLPNALTLGRLLLVPLMASGILVKDRSPDLAMIWFHFYLALALTDLLDGFLARRLRLRTDWGRMGDHLTDVLFGAIAALFMWVAGLLPTWFCLLVLLRFALPPLGGSWLFLREAAMRIEPTVIGRATVLALATLGGAMMYPRNLPSVDLARGILLAFTTAMLILNIGYLFFRGYRASRNPDTLNR
jgi:phosphatidylglycerophosphate synthase